MRQLEFPRLLLVRDLAGTGLFSSEYLVASKNVRNFDLSIGMGWGVLSGNSI